MAGHRGLADDDGMGTLLDGGSTEFGLLAAPPRSVARRYFVAVLASVVATLAALSLSGVLEDVALFSLLLLAVAASCWFGGAGPGLLALVLGAAGWVLLLVDPALGAREFPASSDVLGLALHLCAGGLVVFVIQAQRRAQHIAERAAAEAKSRQAELEEQVRARERAETALRVAERMMALGTMAAGIGHDLGNLLLSMQAQLDTVEARGGAATAEAVASLRQSADYLRSLTRGLRLLALDPKDRAASDPETDLGGWWPTVAALLRTSLPRGVRLDVSVAPGLPPVRVEPHRLTQAVLNLVNNAGQAISDDPGRGGQGVVRFWAEADAREGFLRVGVTDDGPGMAAEVRRRCLEPFFTTKGARGTGLGLALVSGVASDAGGSVRLESEVGRGTTVVMSLPAGAGAEGPTSGEALLARVSIRDARTRALVTALLGTSGFRVADGDGPNGAAVWVADPEEAQPARARQFLEARPAARLIVLGGSAPALEELGAVAIGQPASFDQMRAVFGEAARWVREHGPAPDGR
jgi:signal transduction histidine kinase